MKINQLIFASKLMFLVIFCLCLVYFLPLNANADGSDAGNYYNFNDGKFTSKLPYFFGPSQYLTNKYNYFNPNKYNVGPEINSNRFSYYPYTILYKYDGFYAFNPNSIYLKNVSNNLNNMSYDVDMPSIHSKYAYIDTRIMATGSINNYLNSNIDYGISKNHPELLIPQSYNFSYSLGNKINERNYFENKEFYISNFYLDNNPSGNFNIKMNLNNDYSNGFISKDSKIYTYLIFNTLDVKLSGNVPVFEALRILSYHDLHGDQHNAAVLENREQKVSKDLNEELSNLQNQINNDPQYDSNTQNYLDNQVRNIYNKNDDYIDHYVQQIVHHSREYNNEVLSNLDYQKYNTIKEMKDVLNKKVLLIDSVPNLNFGTQSLSYTSDTVANIQGNPKFKLRSFNNNNWYMHLSLSDMTNGKDSISAKYFQGNNSSYNNKNKIFNFSGNDGVKDISLNKLSIKIPKNIRLHSGNYKGTATWNLVNGPK
ncbi:hypothetical protein [Apilactobacillus micheneri]|uniref:Uncharacterized protein n=1 Tax=Apilactobacillus micheneri TaxID=1899430 RepID=A0A9Q8IPH6_9LACO|nr:hypothetical protein [Apilactobacillus micheneri]TPR41159.1 hypothetical protein DY121_01750 [Apilactobacillus micheneri]TPR42740.1 hypothetical protein DY123_01750 [Apilactobacillus micheneri]TPR46266.1 hypothetical protein DY130_01750 [Apilactobacillus micheneri]TPR46951.1 hypothetical protein DY128_01750 [Apilactobacillus micheneri]TPR48543.1 hypothetical protein DY037_06940 [Apilactobacillus micheneri]